MILPACVYKLSMNATMRLRIAASGKRPMLAIMLWLRPLRLT